MYFTVLYCIVYLLYRVLYCIVSCIVLSRGVTRSDCADLVSPWAVNLEDEEYFEATMTRLAEAVEADNLLYALLGTLVLVSPASKAVPNIAGDARLGRIQAELTNLMYRYLATKAGQTQP